ncbi:MAG: hypothetical protein AB8B55_16110 [Mariniblastus sp.]
MSPRIHNFLKLALTASLLFSAFMVATHHHRETPAVSDVVFEKPDCTCLFHQSEASTIPTSTIPTSDNPLEIPTVPSDHDDCLLCQLLAEFSAESPMAVEFEFDSMVHSLNVFELATVASRPQMRLRGRAPPVV